VASPISGPYILISLMAFVIVYTFVFGAGIYYILHLIRKGPLSSELGETYGAHGLVPTTVLSSKGDPHA
jgi:cytochrome d ubiquinol oxidase subunit I